MTLPALPEIPLAYLPSRCSRRRGTVGRDLSADSTLDYAALNSNVPLRVANLSRSRMQREWGTQATGSVVGFFRFGVSLQEGDAVTIIAGPHTGERFRVDGAPKKGEHHIEALLAVTTERFEDALTPTSLSQALGVATAAFAAAHGVLVGQRVYVTGATPDGFCGSVLVVTVPTPTSLTFAVSAALASPATGTIRMTRVA